MFTCLSGRYQNFATRPSLHWSLMRLTSIQLSGYGLVTEICN